MNLFKQFCYVVLCLFVFFFEVVKINAQVYPALPITLQKKYKHYQSFLPNEVLLTESWIQQKEINNKNYLLEIDPDQLLHNFRINARIPSFSKALEGWESPNSGLRGHFLGHYLSACAILYSKYRDTLILHRLNYLTEKLTECQNYLGGKYLSAFPESDFDTLEKKYGEVWAPYYTYHKIMQGLLDVYKYTGNKRSYAVVLNMADYVSQRMSKLSEEQIEKVLFSATANPTNEAGGMNEALQNLYFFSNDPKHLALAVKFDRKWFYGPLLNGVDILSGLHANTHIALVNGYARRYENTGNDTFKTATFNFWHILLNHHSYINGTSSGPRPIATTPTSRTSEHWGHPNQLSATLSGHIAEACVTHNLQKLSTSLFEWTGNPQYADAYANTFYNAVMSLEEDSAARTVYHLPLGSPRKKEFLKQNDFRCCNGTGIVAFTELSSSIYFHKQNRLYVNMLVPSRLEWNEQGISIEQITQFPENPKSILKISAIKATDFALNLLIPSWANSNSILLINGCKQNIKLVPGTFAKISRRWSNGDSIELKFDFQFYLKKMPDNSKVIAIYYGPVLLAFETEKELILKGNENDILRKLTKIADQFSFYLWNNNTKYNLLPFYKIKNQNYGVYATIRNEF